MSAGAKAAVPPPKPQARAEKPAASTPAPEVTRRRSAAILFDWLEQIAADRALTALAVRAAILIGRRVDWKKGYAHPDQNRLAVQLKVSRRGLQLAIQLLVERGHLGVEASRGRGVANRYFMTAENAKASSHFVPAENANPGSH